MLDYRSAIESSLRRNCSWNGAWEPGWNHLNWFPLGPGPMVPQTLISIGYTGPQKQNRFAAENHWDQTFCLQHPATFFRCYITFLQRHSIQSVIIAPTTGLMSPSPIFMNHQAAPAFGNVMLNKSIAFLRKNTTKVWWESSVGLSILSCSCLYSGEFLGHAEPKDQDQKK